MRGGKRGIEPDQIDSPAGGRHGRAGGGRMEVTAHGRAGWSEVRGTSVPTGGNMARSFTTRPAAARDRGEGDEDRDPRQDSRMCRTPQPRHVSVSHSCHRKLASSRARIDRQDRRALQTHTVLSSAGERCLEKACFDGGSRGARSGIRASRWRRRLPSSQILPGGPATTRAGRGNGIAVRAGGR